MGQSWIVVVNSFKVVRETLVAHGESVSDRPELALQKEVAHGLGEGSNTHRQRSALNSVTLTENRHYFCVYSQILNRNMDVYSI